MTFISRRRPAVLCLLWLMGGWVVFVLPWHVPVGREAVSDSYVLGFSNKTALLGLWATLVALTFCLRGTGEKIQGRFARLLHPTRITRTEVVFLLTFTALHCGTLWLWFRTIPYNNFGEMGYTVSRSELILLGQVPYRDFEWNYGPLMLYCPVLFSWLSGFRIGNDVGYFLTLAGSIALGNAALYFVLSQLRLWRWQRILIFVLLCTAWNVSLGINTTQIRFIMPFAALLLIQRASNRKRESGAGRVKVGLLMLAALLLCFGISPETGMVFSAGLICFGVAKTKQGGNWLLGAGILTVGAALVTIFLLSGNFLRSILNFGSGAYNFPILASLQILLFLGSLCFLIPPLLNYGWNSSQQSAPLGLGLAVMMVLFSTAALGRCDVSHLLNNGLGLFTFALAFWTRYRPRFHFYLATFALLFSIAYPLTYYFTYAPYVVKALRQREQGVRKVDRRFMDANFSVIGSDLLAMETKLRSLKTVGMPLGASEEIEILLKKDRLLAKDYYPMPFSELRTPAHLERKFRDVGAMPYLIVAKQDLYPAPFAAVEYAKQQQRLLSTVMLYPVDYEMQNRPFLPNQQIAAFIRSHFTQVVDFKSFVVMKNNRDRLFFPQLR